MSDERMERDLAEVLRAHCLAGTKINEAGLASVTASIRNLLNRWVAEGLVDLPDRFEIEVGEVRNGALEAIIRETPEMINIDMYLARQEGANE